VNRDDGQIVTDMIAASEARVIARVAEEFRAAKDRFVTEDWSVNAAVWGAAADHLTAKPEPLDLPTMEDWRYALREGPVGWTHDGNKRVANLATAIVEGKARIVEVDK